MFALEQAIFVPLLVAEVYGTILTAINSKVMKRIGKQKAKAMKMAEVSENRVRQSVVFRYR